MYSSIISNGMSSLLVLSSAITLNSISSVVFSLSVFINHGIWGLVQHGPSIPPHCCPSHNVSLTYRTLVLYVGTVVPALLLHETGLLHRT